MNKRNKVKKLSIKQILRRSVHFYKENFSHLAGMSAIIAIYTFFVQSLLVVREMLQEQRSNLLLWWTLAMVGITLLILVMLPKLMLAMFIMIDKLLRKQPCTFKEAYRQTAGKYWAFMEYAVLTALAVSAPGLLFLFFKEPHLRLLYSVAISPLCSALIQPFTCNPLIAIEKRGDGQYYKKANRLQKGNCLTISLLNIGTVSLLTMIEHLCENFFYEQELSLLIIHLIYAAAYFFIHPFSSVVAVVIYRTLREGRAAAKRKKSA